MDRLRVITLAIALGGSLSGAPARASAQEAVAARSAAAPLPSALAGPTGSTPAPVPLRVIDTEAIEARWGIRVEGLHLTAAGYMLDFRFVVLDPAKAAPLFDRKYRPALKDEKTGAVMMVPTPPKTGALRSTNDPKPGRTYFMFFGNPARFITKYSRVTVTVGDFSASGIVVR
jgi:hypothetical protein